MEIYKLSLRVSNAYLVKGDRPILVDTGSPNEAATIRAALQRHDTQVSDLSLILHTHIHSDHVGSTRELAKEAGCPVAYHSEDQSLVDRGDNGPLTGIGLRGKLMSKFFSFAKFDAVDASFVVTHKMRLDAYGIAGYLLHTPGHTAGSISLITDTGDAIAGDTLMGGILGGRFRRRTPRWHYFAEDRAQAVASIDLLLAHVPGDFFVGHGGPLAHSDVKRWRQAQLQNPM